MLEHQWERKDKPGDYWEVRHCKICKLEDMRICKESREEEIKQGRGRSRHEWEVTTPCIEPVPKSIEFEDLVSELKQHKVTEKPYVQGIPGEWSVGFYIGGKYSVYPGIKVKTLERGWSELLRWTRARQYNVHFKSQLDYMRKLGEDSGCGCDDD